MKQKWMLGIAILGAVCAAWFFLGRDTSKTSVEDPPCVIWKHGVTLHPAIDLDYRGETCQHIAAMLNRDEYMVGTSPVSTPTFECRCTR